MDKLKVEDVFNVDPIGNANLKIRSEIKSILKEIKGDKVEMIESFSDDFYQPIDIAIFDEENDEWIACLILNKKHYFSPSLIDWPIKFQIYDMRAWILEVYGWQVLQISELEWVKKSKEERHQFVSSLIKGSSV